MCVTQKRGVLKIAEVASRVEDKNQFIKKIESIGFKLVTTKTPSNVQQNYFCFFDFVKLSPDIKKKPQVKLSPCVYKKR